MTPRIFVAAFAVLLLAGYMYARPQFGPAVVKEPTKEPVMAKDNQPASPLDFKVKDIDGKDVDLSRYKGKVVLIVNVASKCGFTKQYTGLESVYKKYADKGFVIIGFPANDFGKQEPGSNGDIKTFCTSKFDVTFPMMAKISTKGEEKAPIYKFLTEKPTAGDFAGEIEWNFTKFLLDRNGNLIARWPSPVKPEDEQVSTLIEKALAAKPATAMADKK